MSVNAVNGNKHNVRTMSICVLGYLCLLTYMLCVVYRWLGWQHYGYIMSYSGNVMVRCIVVSYLASLSVLSFPEICIVHASIG